MNLAFADVFVDLVPPASRDAAGYLRAFVRCQMLVMANGVLVAQFGIRDIRVIQMDGAVSEVVCMPSRLVRFTCGVCGSYNEHVANYCGECGGELPVPTLSINPRNGKPKKSYDVFFPSNAETRRIIERPILEAYRAEVLKQQGAAVSVK